MIGGDSQSRTISPHRRCCGRCCDLIGPTGEKASSRTRAKKLGAKKEINDARGAGQREDKASSELRGPRSQLSHADVPQGEKIAVPNAHMAIVIISKITDKHTADAMNVALGVITKTPNKERIRGGGRTNEQHPPSTRLARMCRGSMSVAVSAESRCTSPLSATRLILQSVTGMTLYSNR